MSVDRKLNLLAVLLAVSIGIGALASYLFVADATEKRQQICDVTEQAFLNYNALLGQVSARPRPPEEQARVESQLRALDSGVRHQFEDCA